MDPILKAADQVTDSGDAIFEGESQDCYLVHTKELAEGYIYVSADGETVLEVLRRASVEEYKWRCPQIPDLVKPERYFIYLTRRAVKVATIT